MAILHFRFQIEDQFLWSKYRYFLPNNRLLCTVSLATNFIVISFFLSFMWLNRQWYFHNATDYKLNQSLLLLHFVNKPLKWFLQSQNSNWVSFHYFMHQLIKWFPVRLKSEKLKSYNQSKLLPINLSNWNLHRRFLNGCDWNFSTVAT